MAGQNRDPLYIGPLFSIHQGSSKNWFVVARCCLFHWQATFLHSLCGSVDLPRHKRLPSSHNWFTLKTTGWKNRPNKCTLTKMSKGIHIHGTYCNKIGLDKIERGGHAMWTNWWPNFSLGHAYVFFGDERKKGPLWGKTVTRAYSYWGSASIEQNLRVELSLGQNVGGRKTPVK